MKNIMELIIGNHFNYLIKLVWYLIFQSNRMLINENEENENTENSENENESEENKFESKNLYKKNE